VFNTNTPRAHQLVFRTVLWYEARFCAAIECITLRIGFMTNGIGRNVREAAEVDIQATLFTKGDSLIMYTNYTTKCSLLH